MKDDIVNNILEVIKNETSSKLLRQENLKNRFRVFSFIIYPDTESYDFYEVLRNVKTYKNYAFMKHDQDLDKEGHLKKEHYHVILKVDNACTISAISKKIGIPDNYVQNVKNERTMVRYLVHEDDSDKYHYDKNKIICSPIYSRYVGRCFMDLESEEVQLNNIYREIEKLASNTTNYHDALQLLVQYVNINCYDTVYKRYRFELKDYLTSLY